MSTGNAEIAHPENEGLEDDGSFWKTAMGVFYSFIRRSSLSEQKRAHCSLKVVDAVAQAQL